MVCPVDNTALVMSDRQGIEIDYCPKCRGVWLDRGELDKIIDRNASFETDHQASQSRRPDDDDGHDYDRRNDYRDDRRRDHNSDNRHYSDDHQGNYQKKHKREGFLGDIFDF